MTSIALGSTIPTITSQSQFVALVTSSHPRCGASSPARCVFSIRPLAESLWDAIVVSTTLDCVLVVGPSYKYVHHVSFGLCGALSSVSRSPALLDVPRHARRWLTPRLFTHQDAACESTITVQRIGAAKPSKIPGSYNDALNGKWIVACGRKSTTDSETGLPVVCNSISVRKIVHSGGGGGGIKTVVSEAVVVTLSGPLDDCGIRPAFSRMNQDEVLLQGYYDYHLVLTLIDVEATFQSKKAVVLCCSDLGEISCCYEQMPIAMRRKDGAPVFLVRPSARRNEVVAVDSTTCTPKVVSNKCGGSLTQVSSSVFCVGNWELWSFELWDCNNLDQPLRAMRPGADHYDQVIGGSGFLFALSDGKVVVMEAHSQLAPSTITSQGQFVALVTSSHPRCGASSPARCVCSIRPLVESLWDAIVVSTAIDCVLVFESATSSVNLHVSFEMCRSLCSVSRSPALINAPQAVKSWLSFHHQA
ncbi:hypothetical protein Pelo_17095 [Pelomyxa schiedti]|nr:hypothetical protein Pelo_17095 [Pelomyxa schiedti]